MKSSHGSKSQYCGSVTGATCTTEFNYSMQNEFMKRYRDRVKRAKKCKTCSNNEGGYCNDSQQWCYMASMNQCNYIKKL